jgi:hypothetical protein
LPEGSAAPIDFSLVSGRVVTGYSLFGPSVTFAPTLAIEAGAILTSQGGTSARATAVPWVGLGIGGLGQLRLSGRISTYLHGELSIPLTGASFALSDGAVFHDAAVGGRLELGLRFFWTDE